MHAKDLIDRVKGSFAARAALRQGPTLHITTRRNGIVRLWKTPNNGRTFGVLYAKFDAVVAVKEGGTQGAGRPARQLGIYTCAVTSRLRLSGRGCGGRGCCLSDVNHSNAAIYITCSIMRCDYNYRVLGPQHRQTV
jgi:hypothetical protein